MDEQEMEDRMLSFGYVKVQSALRGFFGIGARQSLWRHPKFDDKTFSMTLDEIEEYERGYSGAEHVQGRFIEQASDLQMYHIDLYDLYDGAGYFEAMAISAADALQKCRDMNSGNPDTEITGDPYVKKY